MTLRLARPFVTATAHRTEKQTIVVRFEHDGLEGFGEAVPTDLYGQTLESAERALDSARRLLGDDPTAIEAIVDGLVDALDDQRAAVAAIDAALHDWNGKRLRRSVVDWLGLDARKCPVTSYTLGIDEPLQLLARMSEAASFPIWKIKVGHPDELATLALVRRHSPERLIRVDANTAWPKSDACTRLEQIASFNVELVEQPSARDDLETLGRLKSMHLCPIIADESCVVPADVDRVAPYVDGINIKLAKCGGIVEARRMIHRARERGLRIMIGCMIESSLGIAAAAQLAPLADWIDLDGHLLLRDDPFTGIGGAAGRLTLAAGPGLGVRRHDDRPLT